MKKWKPYNPDSLVQLAREQHPDKPWLADALAACTRAGWGSRKHHYLYFVDPANANQPGAECQFEREVWLDDPKVGWLNVDVLTGGRIGGVAFYDRLFSGGLKHHIPASPTGQSQTADPGSDARS